MRRVLIIDDDPMTRRDASRALSKADYEVLESASPLDGIRCAKEERPDIILLDILMPEMDGICVLRQLRDDSETTGIPVIMLTSCGGESQVAACLEEGAVDHITKPFSHRELCARVSAFQAKRMMSRYADELNADPTSKHAKRVVAFIGVKGGVGATTLAANVASSAANNDGSVMLCELRSKFGTLSLQLNSQPRDHLGTLMANVKQCPDVEIERYVVRESSGLQILFGPRAGDPDIHFEVSQLRAMVDKLRTHANLVLLDLEAGLTDVNKEILKVCDRVVLVLDCEETSIEAAKLIIDDLQHTTIRHSIKAVVVKRTTLSLPPKIDDIRSSLGCDLIGVIPPDADALAFAVNKGATLMVLEPNNDISGTIQRLTEEHIQLATYEMKFRPYS